MGTSNSYTIVHFLDEDKHDFNTLMIPLDLLNLLANHLKQQYQEHQQNVCRHDFRAERAKQHDRYIQYCQETQTDPKQIFIDFPIK